MKKVISIILLLFCLNVSAATAQNTANQTDKVIGINFPDLSAESLAEQKVVLPQADVGKVTLIMIALKRDSIPQLDRATVFCLPCRIDTDGNRDALPTVLLEALAVGVPVISTRVTGIPEILDNGRVGSLVDSDDPAAIAEGLRSVLEDPSRRAEVVAHGLEHVRQNFDGKAAARTLGAWLDEVERGVVVR